MNNIFFKRTSLLLSLATITVSVFASGISAHAQTANSSPARAKDTKISTSAAALKSEPSATVVAQVQPTTPSTNGTVTPTTPGTVTPTTPGTVTPSTTPETTPTEPAPVIEPGRTTRGGSSYIGAAGNIGLGGGDTALGLGNFTVISKIGLTNAVSARPSIVIGDNVAILIPVTYDFTLQPTGADTEVVSDFAPYIGGGLAIATGDNSDVGPMLTAGVDVPLGAQFTATAGVNAGFFDDTSVGLLIGVGYNFGAL